MRYVPRDRIDSIKKASNRRVSRCTSWELYTSLKVAATLARKSAGSWAKGMVSGKGRLGASREIPGGQYVRTISQKVGKASMAEPLAVMKLKGEVKIVISRR